MRPAPLMPPASCLIFHRCPLPPHSSSAHSPIVPKRSRTVSCARARRRGCWHTTIPSAARSSRLSRRWNGPGWSESCPMMISCTRGASPARPPLPVVERKMAEGRRWVFFGPRLDTPPLDPFEGELVLDQPGVIGIAFGDRAAALAHFLRATGGAGAILRPTRAARTRTSAHAPVARADRPGAGHPAPPDCRMVRGICRRRALRRRRRRRGPLPIHRSGN